MSGYKKMDFYIESFVNLLKEGLEIGRKLEFKETQAQVKHVVMAGLGGSGIGAEIVLNYLERSTPVPIVLAKDYFLPGFVNEETLVIVCSYSGNTEEALYVLEEAISKKATIVCITSGGKLQESAQANNIDCIQLPAGIPPRACIGCSFSQVLFVLQQFALIDNSFEAEISSAIKLLSAELDTIKKEAAALAEKLQHKLPVIYSDQRIAGVATRWRQQFNENSKVLGWERPFPEMNHNELVGWRDQAEHLAVIFLHTGGELDRVSKRFAINRSVICNFTDSVFDIVAKGDSFLERAAYLILLGDWTSWYLAELRGVDAVEVNVIDYLKNALSKD
ncbi:MAG: bifunctional phosphoglucose/phosphomannose isomerase [Sphingobacteriales bacterium]|nr:MAG: bifunctional phosphoglucose/phosphomannose isomerase [Sphingobacteriales bacterium]